MACLCRQPLRRHASWRSQAFSLRVPTRELQTLPALLWPIARDDARLRRMQRELACSWRALFWTSLVGSCFGEDALGDAFGMLMTVLRSRVLRSRVPLPASSLARRDTKRGGVAARRTPPSGATSRRLAPCEAAVLPSHLAARIRMPERSIAPGCSTELLELGRGA